MRLTAVVATGFLLASCASHSANRPEVLLGYPLGDDLDQRTCRARKLSEGGEMLTALEIIDGVLSDEPNYIDAHRVRQDVFRRRGRVGRLLWEGEQRLMEDPDSASAQYLLGRLQRTDPEKREYFERATAADPTSFWGWYGLAFTLRSTDPKGSFSIYHWLYEVSKRHPVTAVALASALRLWDRPDEAAKVYGELRSNPLAPGIGDLGLAEVWSFSPTHGDQSWPALLKALELRPRDPGARQLLQQWLARGLPLDQLVQVVDVLQRDPDRVREFAAGDYGITLAQLYYCLGRAVEARAVLEADDGAGLTSPAAYRLWARLLLQTGDVPGFLDAIGQRYPQSLFDDQRNQLRGLWGRLLAGPWMDSDDPIADPAVATQLIDALVDTGLLDEADALATVVMLRYGHLPAAETRRIIELRDEARRELAFERSIRRFLYHGYSNSEGPDLDSVLGELRRISKEILGRDVVGEPTLFEVPLVGQILDPFSADLCQHFARYNRHFVLGQRAGQPVEGLMLVRLSKRELDQVAELPLDRQAWEVVGEDRRIRSFSSVYGGDLAGVALINHYLVDMDSVRDWAREIVERRRIVREDDRVQLEDPLPDDIATLDPAAVEWRLSMLSPVGDADLEDAVLDMIRWHERAHLVDVYRYLPVENNLWRTLGLLFGHGFDRASIEGEMEGRAEVAALAMSNHTRLVLAHVAVFLESDSELSPHAVGFRRLARRLARSLEKAGVDNRASRWHLIDPADVRAIAQEMLREQWP